MCYSVNSDMVVNARTHDCDDFGIAITIYDNSLFHKAMYRNVLLSFLTYFLAEMKIELEVKKLILCSS